MSFYGGSGGIRTLEPFDRLHAFQACALDHYATLPRRRTKLASFKFYLYKIIILLVGAPFSQKRVLPLSAVRYSFLGALFH